MFKEGKELYEFGQFRLDVTEHFLVRLSGNRVQLSEKAFETLCVLVRNNGHLLSKSELLNQVWADSFVEENNLDKCIYAIRRVLGEKPGEQKFIETVRKHGYRFVAEVRRVEEDELTHEESAIQSKEKQSLPAKFPRLIKQIETQTSGAVVALADWQHESDKNQPEESTSEKSTEQTTKLELAPSKPVSRSKPTYSVFIVTGLILAIALAGLGYGLYSFNGENRNKTLAVFNTTNIKRLTSNGNSSYPVISPDGKFIAYVLREAGNRLSIQLMHVETGGTQQLFAQAEYRNLGSPAFSRDGNYIYFAQSETIGVGPINGLYRMSVLGGVPTRLITDFSWYAIPPDGMHLAFVRNSRSADESVLMIANADGSGEYRLGTRKLSDPFRHLNWSPDGKTIACSVGSAEVSGERMYPIEIRVEDGTERELTSERWQYLSYVLWLADGSGLIVSGSDKQSSVIGAWHISFPGGEVQMLTGIPEIYTINSQTADSKTVVAQTVKLQTNIWIMPIGNGTASPAALARQITTGNDGNQVGYMPDGRLLFTSANSRSQPDIWVMNADGTERKQLTADAGANSSSSVSADGRYIVFESDRAGKINIWRMDADGGNPKQLTFGDNEKSPDLSPDGKWIVYTSADDSTLWRVPIDGGEAKQLTGKNWRGSLISPDGKRILSTYREPKTDARTRIGIIPFDGGEPVKMFDIPPEIQWNGGGQWTPDAQAIIYISIREGFSNIWKQPINGGKPTQLTDFKSTEEIYSPNFSPDGKQIAFSRGGWMFDILLIRDFR